MRPLIGQNHLPANVCFGMCVYVCDSRISEAKGQVQHVILLISDGPQLVVHLLIQDHMTGGTGQGPLTRTWGTHI